MATVIATFQYRHEAEFARALLEDAGIRSILSVDDAGGIYLGLAFSNPARILVAEEDADQALEVLRDAGLGPEPEAPDEPA